MDAADPDKLALLFVQQYLHEHGYQEALEALERRSGVFFCEDKLDQGGRLMELVWRKMEDQLAAEVDDTALSRMAEEESLLRGGLGNFVNSNKATIAGVHRSNVVCIRIWPERDALLTGAGDGAVRCITLAGEVLWTAYVGSGGVLSIDLLLQPQGPGGSVVAAGSMDGSVSVLDATSGALLASDRPHTKYVVRVMWARGGAALLSGAYDNSLALHDVALTWSESCAMHQAQITPGSQRVLYGFVVHDVALLTEREQVVVALRGTNYMRVHPLHDLKAEERVNLNERGDDHLSFSAKALRPSHDERLLLVSTDTARIIIYRTKDWTVLRNLYGLVVDTLHTPCAAWHADGHYVYAAAAGGWLFIFHVGSSRVVAKLHAHSGLLRDMHFDAGTGLMATASFDKTAKVWVHEPSAMAEAYAPTT